MWCWIVTLKQKWTGTCTQAEKLLREWWPHPTYCQFQIIISVITMFLHLQFVLLARRILDQSERGSWDRRMKDVHSALSTNYSNNKISQTTHDSVISTQIKNRFQNERMLLSALDTRFKRFKQENTHRLWITDFLRSCSNM